MLANTVNGGTHVLYLQIWLVVRGDSDMVRKCEDQPG